MAEREQTGPIPAVLGWSNAGPDSLQLYALDAGGGPRWLNPPNGRTVEFALAERGGHFEGDRYLLVPLGDRFVSQAMADHVAQRITEVVAEARRMVADGKLKDGA